MVGTLPFGFLPGLPFGRSLAGAPAPASAETPRVLPSLFVLFIIRPPARWSWSRLTVAVSATDLKHLFDRCRKCRCRAVRLYRIFVRSNGSTIEHRYYRTAIRSQGGRVSVMSAAEARQATGAGHQIAMPGPWAANPARGRGAPFGAGHGARGGTIPDSGPPSAGGP